MGTTNVQEVRPAAVAGRHYPEDRDFLAKTVDRYLASGKKARAAIPKSIIAPHGGYIYSGEIAGSAFKPWIGLSGVKRIVIIGPSHFYDFPGVALPDVSVFVTPLGKVEVDRAAVERLRKLNFVRAFEAAHEPEHAIEVELPFIQRLFGAPLIVPLITGATDAAEVARVIELLWGGDETLFILSSDLSHHLDYAGAQRSDAATAHLIKNLEEGPLRAEQACGYQAIGGFLRVAASRKIRCAVADLRNSGDTAGEHGEVIGYGAFHFFES